MAQPTIVHQLEQNAVRYGDRSAYHDNLTGSWRSTTWREFNRLTRQVGNSLLSLGLDEGDVVTILANNRPEWTISALGAMRIGGICAGIYTTNSAGEVAYIVGHGESKVIVVENDDQLAKVLETWDDLPELTHAVLLDGTPPADDDRVLSWTDFLDVGTDVLDDRLDTCMDRLGPDQVADFIYTSGTTGPPKAVMLTHENLAWTAGIITGSVDAGIDDVVVSYLPLSHIAEQMSSVHGAITAGYAVYYCHDGLKLADYLNHAQPTIFFGVPRVYERMQSAISDQLRASTGIKATLLERARAVGSEAVDVLNAGGELSGALAVKYQVADKLLAKVRNAIGLGRARILVAGAAPMSVGTLEFFASLGMSINELYGQSEDSGPTTTNLPGAVKFGTVGRPFPGVEVKLDEDDEIIVRGKNVFAGYYKNDEATAETVIDGWLRSGDLGAFDEDGFLTIVGRKKDIIITSGGKNIAPRNLEDALTSIEMVSHAVCVGEQQRYLVAMLTLDPEVAARRADELGVSTDDLPGHPQIRSEFETEITTTVNSQFARVEQIRNFRILPNHFSVETGELTPTLKLKRSVVNEMYAAEIAACYEEGQLL